ncbi:MAG: hypothetical protein R3E32_23980 [Chitinophagales bacterium]
MSRLALEEEIILKSVKDLRVKVKGMGGRKLFHRLQEDGIFHKHAIKMGRDKFFNLLGENNLLDLFIQADIQMRLKSCGRISTISKLPSNNRLTNKSHYSIATLPLPNSYITTTSLL